MNKCLKIGIYVIVFILIGTGVVFAQDEMITLNLSRDFGYSSGSGKIQGLFSMKVATSIELKEVVFYIDSKSIGKDTLQPYNLQFNTDDYTPGLHTLYAIGYTLDGKEIRTRQKKTEFVSAQESKKALLTLLVPILGLSLLVVLVSAAIPALTVKNKVSIAPGTERNYGAAGGTICSRCSRPFSRHVFAPNMLFGKLERCPHCGKWGIFRTYPIDALRKAEESELEEDRIKSESNLPANEDENLRDKLDDTKYQGL